jgi:tellurite resistance protein TerC
LLLVLLVVESTDVLFAVDSIPAIFAVTSDPFLIFTSNVFAILGLRSLYFVLAGVMDRFRYLKMSLVFLLAFVGVKMLLAHHYPIPTLVSLAIISGILSVGVLASIFAGDRDSAALYAPPAEGMDDWVEYSWKRLRRVAILLLGASTLVVGLAMIAGSRHFGHPRGPRDSRDGVFVGQESADQNETERRSDLQWVKGSCATGPEFGYRGRCV